MASANRNAASTTVAPSIHLASPGQFVKLIPRVFLRQAAMYGQPRADRFLASDAATPKRIPSAITQHALSAGAFSIRNALHPSTMSVRSAPQPQLASSQDSRQSASMRLRAANSRLSQKQPSQPSPSKAVPSQSVIGTQPRLDPPNAAQPLPLLHCMEEGRHVCSHSFGFFLSSVLSPLLRRGESKKKRVRKF